MNSILITGCNRGLGLGIVKALSQLPKGPQHLFATCRKKEQATELQELAQKHNNIHIIEIDLLQFDRYDNLVQQISEITEGNGLNVLFNNAGIAPKSARITAVREKEIVDTFVTNTVVPIMLTKAFLPLLKKAASANKAAQGVERAAIINMSSILGSIESNNDGGMYAYRCSKSALNAATKSMSVDANAAGILCVSMHPGWVKTDMGGKNAPLEVDTSCQQLLQTIMNFNNTHNGGFYQYDGQKLAW